MILKLIKTVFIFIAIVSTVTTAQIAANYIAVVETRLSVQAEVAALMADIGNQTATISLILNVTNPSSMEVLVRDVELSLYIPPRTEKIAFATNYTHVRIQPGETISKYLHVQPGSQAFNYLKHASDASATGRLIWLISGTVWLKIEKFDESWRTDVNSLYPPLPGGE